MLVLQDDLLMMQSVLLEKARGISWMRVKWILALLSGRY